MSEKRKVPKLRFPGFSDHWAEKKLGPICSKVGSGKTPRGGDQTYQTSGIPFIRSQNVQDSKLLLDGVCISPETHSEMANSAVVSGDVLLNITGGSIGRSCVVPENFQEGNVNQHVCIIRLKKDSPNFLHSILSSHRGQKLIFQGQTGSGREGLNFESIKAFKINVPSVSEQQKIASFLTSVDRRIELLQQKKEKLERYKKGVMQQLFNRKIRFKADDGSEFPDWEEKKLGDVYEFRTTNSFSRDKLNYESGEYRNIHYGDIHTKFPTVVDLDEIDLPYVNEDVEIRKTFSDNSVQAGDLIIADASEDYADIGKTIEIVNTAGQKVLAGLHTLHARRRDANVEMGFGGYIMKSDGLRTQIMKIAQGTKVLSISVPRMRELDLALPCLEEQKKIVQFLTSLDRCIENLNQQITHKQTWKKGLLQKMFV